MIKTPLHAESLKNVNSMPKVYISNITIEDCFDYSKSKREDRIEATFRNDTYQPFDDRSNEDSATASKNTKVRINMVAYLTYKQIKRYSTFNDPSMVIRVVKSENADINEAISSNPSEWLSENGLLYARNRDTRTVSHVDIPFNQFFRNVSTLKGRDRGNKKELQLDSIIRDQSFEEITFSSSGKHMYVVPYEASFMIYTSDIQHLTLFAFPMIKDVSFAGFKNSACKKLSIGPLTSENVFSNGELSRTSFAFHSPSGEYWTGPVHYHQVATKDGYVGWMGGTNEHMQMGRPTPKLQKFNTYNNKIIDKRMSDIVKSMSYDFYEKEDFFKNDKSLERVVNSVTSKAEYEKTKNSVSDINFSFDSNTDVRFIFHINLDQIARDATKMPALLEAIKRKNKYFYSNIVSPAIVQNVKVYRQLLKSRDLTILSRDPSLDPSYDQEELIFESTAQNLSIQSVLYETSSPQRNRDIPGARQSAISTMRQVNLKISNSENIVTYTGIDFDVKNKGDGKYQYSLELTVADPITNFVNSSLDALDVILNGNSTTTSLSSYYDEINSSSNYYNEKTRKFTNSYIDFYKENYYNQGNVDYIEDMVRIFVDTLALINVSNNYKKTRQAQTTVSEISELYKYLVNISSPYTGSPDGVLELISLVRMTKNNFFKSISALKSYSRRNDGNDEQRLSPNADSSGRQHYNRKRYQFKNILDMSAPLRGKFYDFLFLSSNDVELNKDGLSMLNKSHFIDRVNAESKKLFGRTEGDLIIRDENENVYNPSDSIQRNKCAFLGPTRIILDDKRSVDTYSRDAFNENTSEINNALNEILYHNQSVTTESGLEFAIQNGISHRTTKNKMYESQLANQRQKEAFLNSRSDTMYNDEPELFEENTQREHDNMSTSIKNIFNSINQAKNSNFLSDSNNVDFYNINNVGGAERFKKKVSGISRLNKQPVDSNIELVNSPNHLKSLIMTLSSPQRSTQSVLNDENNVTLNKNTLRDPEKQGYVYFNYKKLMKIEVLRGFGGDKSSQSTISPVWSYLRQEDLNSKAGGLLYCRMMEYEDVNFGYEIDKNLSLPSRNKYFLINTAAEDTSEIPSYMEGGNTSSSRGYESHFKRSLNKSIADFRDQRKKIFGNPNMCAKVEFFENNITIKSNQPYLNLKDVSQAYKMASTDLQFVNKTESEKIKTIERNGNGDVLKNIRKVSQGPARGLQTTSPISMNRMTTLQTTTTNRASSMNNMDPGVTSSGGGGSGGGGGGGGGTY